jgi:hypothetical protein
MKTLLALVAFAALAGPAAALIDENHNSLGAYFDPAGDINCFAPTPLVPFTLYWIVANPVFSRLGGFEFAWSFAPTVVPAPVILETTLPPLSLNIGTDYNLIVGLGGGLYTTEATILVSFEMMMVAPADGETYITAGPPTPPSHPGHATMDSFSDSIEMVDLNFSTVDDVTVVADAAGWVVPGVAKLSCPGPIATETTTWGELKALFR